MSIYGNPVMLGGSGGGGGGSTNVLSGASVPTAAQGSNGAMYLKYFQAPSAIPASATLLEYIQNTAGQYVNTGYSGNDDSRYVIDFTLSSAQTADWPTPFGGRPNVANVTNAQNIHLARNEKNYDGQAVGWGILATNVIAGVGATAMVGKRTQIILEAGNLEITIDGTHYQGTFTPGTVTNSTPIGIFTMLVNDSPQSFGNMNAMRLHSFKIYENDVLQRDFYPVLDSNGVPCLYDIVTGNYYYNQGSGNFTAGPVVNEGIITDTYAKVNGAWQDLIGTDIDDINLGS